ncbi:SGNH/GDSL hydrolase family protein [Caballeronia sp. TF1N1]|uniref:SGNH/GDSL hydrolase family protein n=1 Tax=Caballeronia sp. TF1N1 TaxID=2878153 RepID=UPI001FCFFD40|nr:SGNH/GDSL hydrolase family protein [Caballeronia sp. TF1N1]
MFANINSMSRYKAGAELSTTAIHDAAVKAVSGGGNSSPGSGDPVVLRFTDKVYRNFVQDNTHRLRMALSRAAASNGRARIVFLGDSFCSGYGNYNGAHSRYGAQVARMLSARGWNVRNDGFHGDAWNGGSIDDFLALDQRVSYFGNVAIYDSAYPTLGGRLFEIRGEGNLLSFAPDSGNTFDTVDVLVPMNMWNNDLVFIFHDGNGNDTAEVPAGITHGLHGMKMVTVTTPDGFAAKSLTITCHGRDSAYLAGLNCRDSQKPGIEVIVAGVAGGRMADWSVNPVNPDDDTYFDSTTYNVQASLAALCADFQDVPTIFITEGWANDWDANNITPAQATDLAGALIDKLSQWGDNIWLGYSPMSPTYKEGVNLEELVPVYNEAVFKAATDRGLPVIDPWAIYPSFETTANMGLTNDGVEHPSGEGHAIFARSIISAFDSIF